MRSSFSRDALLPHTPILICDQRIQRVPVQRYIVHENPEVGDGLFGDEVAGEEKEGSEKSGDERVSWDEVGRDCGEEEDERAGHEEDEPDEEGEEGEGGEGGVEADEEVEREGEEEGDGEEEGEEDEGVGEEVGGDAVGSSGGFLHQHASLLEVDWEGFHGGG